MWRKYNKLVIKYEHIFQIGCRMFSLLANVASSFYKGTADWYCSVTKVLSVVYKVCWSSSLEDTYIFVKYISETLLSGASL